MNDKGEILRFQLTKGNVADVSMTEILTKGIIGKIFGDKGYISAQATKNLLKKGLQLFTSLRSKMKQNLCR
jgi:hypothetical protein